MWWIWRRHKALSHTTCWQCPGNILHHGGTSGPLPQLCHEKAYFFMVVQSLSSRFWAPSNTPCADIALPNPHDQRHYTSISKSDYITTQCQHFVLRYAVGNSQNSLLVVLSQNSLPQSYAGRSVGILYIWCILNPEKISCSLEDFLYVDAFAFLCWTGCSGKPVLSTSRLGHGPRVISLNRPSSLRNASSDHTDNICCISVFLKLEAMTRAPST
jgi:hypothetical protein